jgi:hypothetical protein
VTASGHRAPFSPDAATAEIVRTLKAYGVTRVGGDRYAGEWVKEAFRKNGVTYEHSELPRSGLYIDFLPRLNSRTVSLLDHLKLVYQLADWSAKRGRGRRHHRSRPRRS